MTFHILPGCFIGSILWIEHHHRVHIKCVPLCGLSIIGSYLKISISEFRLILVDHITCFVDVFFKLHLVPEWHNNAIITSLIMLLSVVNEENNADFWTSLHNSQTIYMRECWKSLFSNQGFYQHSKWDKNYIFGTVTNTFLLLLLIIYLK